MNPSAPVLAIDLGTSGPKVALVAAGKLVAWERDTTLLQLGAGGAAEQDPDDWWASICRATRRLLSRSELTPDAVSVTAQWSGTVAVDESGAALRPAILWMDTRGAPYIEGLTRGWPRFEGYGLRRLARWLRLTGGAPGKSGKDPIAHIAYLRSEEPDVYARARCFLEPKDYLNLKLTGRRAASFDSISLHWVTDNRDADRVRYDPTLLSWADLDRERLPELLPASSILGELLPAAALALGAPAGIPVVVGTPDLHSAALGSGALKDFAAHGYLGTSSWISCHVPFKKTDILHNMATLPSPLPGRYFVANTQESAGACINFAIERLLYPNDELGAAPMPERVHEVFERVAAGSPPGANGVVFAPWLAGERTPVEDASVRGGFFNVALGSTRADLLRAIYEGVALNSAWLFTHLQRFVGRSFDSVAMVGGGAQSKLWCQIYADVLGVPIHQVDEPLMANCRGAAALAELALARASVEEVSESASVRRVFEPRGEFRNLYDERCDSLIAMYRACRKAGAKLN